MCRERMIEDVDGHGLLFHSGFGLWAFGGGGVGRRSRRSCWMTVNGDEACGHGGFGRSTAGSGELLIETLPERGLKRHNGMPL